MRLDFCRMTSTTGGTSTLTCTAQTGYPDVAEAFTGTIFVDYSIAEYTSSAKTQLSKAETGIGSIVTSTGVLTRTKVLSTWDGTDYLPKFGTATAPAAINFGTTSANIDIMMAATAAGVRSPFFATVGAVASVCDGYGTLGLNMTPIAGGTFSPTSGVVYYFPIDLPLKQYSQVSFRELAAVTGGSPTVDVALFEVNQSDGLPGRLLAAFTQKAIGAANTNYQTTALATPVPVGGWLWCGFLWLAGGGAGAATFRSTTFLGGGMSGTLFSNGSATSPLNLASQTAFTDPATAPTANNALNAVPGLVFI